MVLCIIPGCRVKSGNKEGISLFRILIVVDKNGESYKQLTEDRRNAWISQISRDDTKWKDILKSERVCGRHVVSGKPALLWDRYNVDWKPTLNLGKKDYSKEPDLQAAAARADRAKDPATKQGNRFLNNNNASMRRHASEQLSAVNLTKVASRSRRLTLLHHQGKRDWKARV